MFGIHIPPFHDWISSSAFFLLGSFVVSIVLGLIGVKEMISKKLIIFLVGISLLVTTAGLWSTAKQQEDTDLQETKIDDLSKNMKRIADAANLNPTPGQSAQDLANRVIAYLGELDKRITVVEHPPRDNQILYLGNQPIANILGVIPDPTDKTRITFQRVSSANPIDFSRQYYFQWAILLCAPIQSSGFSVMGAQQQILYLNLSCRVVGNAPP